MKKTVHYLSVLIAILALITPSRAVQLSGSYTINPLLAASTTNFQNINSAVTYMTSTGVRSDGGPSNSGTVGVSGPVVFILSAATFNEQVSIPAITGASSTNNITFRGAGRTSTIFTFSSSDNNNRHTLRFSQATHVTFRDMTIRATGSVGWVVHIFGLNTNFNSIRNCTVEITGTGATSGSTVYSGIVINNSVTSATTGTRVDGTVIDSSSINAGYYGIVAFGTSGNLHVGMVVSNCTIINSNFMSIYGSFINGITVHNNLMLPAASNSFNYGLYLVNSNCTAGNRHVITNNRIHRFGYYGIYISGSSNLSGNKGLMLNNMVGGGVKYEFSQSVYLTSTSQWSIAHNAFLYDIAGTSNIYSAVYITGGSGISYQNNIASSSIASASLPFYATSSASFDTMNFNVFHRRDTSNGVLIFVGTNLNSGSFKGASGFNTNSLAENPQFVNDTALRTNNPCFLGTPLAYAPTDLNGTTRSLSSPSIGTLEVASVANNLAVLSVLQPRPPIVAGATDLWIQVRNLGNNTITSYTMSYRLNGGAPDSINWFGSLPACAIDSIGFTGTQQPTLGSVNNFRIYSSRPNILLDGDRNNDTIQASYFLPLSGTYNIGGGTPQFAKPSDAFNALQQAGLSGPVTFIVHPGTYIDQITIDNPILGLSATNTVNLIGTNRDSCIIQTVNTSSSARHTIRVGQSYIFIRNLTLQANSPSFGWIVHINKNNIRNVHVKNCRLENIHPIALTSTSDAFAGVVMSGSNTNLYYYDTYVLDSIEIDSNIIRNGYAGVFQYSYFYNYYYTYGAPSIDIKVRSNTISNMYYMGIAIQGIQSVAIQRNTVQMRKDATGIVYNYGIYLQALDATNTPTHQMSITNNRTWGSNYMAMYISGCAANSLNRGQVHNNAAQVGFNLTDAYAFYMNSCSNINLYHNTFLATNASTSTTTGAAYIGSNTALRMRNNHFVLSNSTSTATPMYAVGNTFTSAAEFNFNNYYRADTTGQFVYINTWYAGSAFRGVGGNNTNSIITNPNLLNDSNLYSLNSCINGDTVASVSEDLTGLSRAVTPDIGAYEIPSPANDIGVTSVLAPQMPVQIGSQDLVLQFRNFGSNTITSATIGYRYNGGATVSQTWFGSLLPCDTGSTTFTGTNQINVLAGSVNSLRGFTSAPNGVADGNTINDTLNAFISTPLKGTYIVGPAPSNYTTIAQAVDALNLRGVDSVVTFRIKTGVYAEKIQLGNVFGISATNTVTFTSVANNADSVVIATNNGAADNFVVNLTSGARFFNFTRLTFQSTNFSNGRVVQLQGTAFENSFTRCKFISPTVSTTSTFNAIVFASPLTGAGNRFVNNEFIGGSYGFYVFGTSTLVLTDRITIDSNQFTNQFFMGGGQFYYTSNLKFRYNQITTTSTSTNYYGLNSFYSDSSMEITHNRIFTTTANGRGIETQYCDGFGAQSGLIANNVIRVGSGSNLSNWGLRDQYSSNMLIANNTVVVNSTSTNSYAGYFFYNTTVSNTTRIRNNIFMNASTGYALYHFNPNFGSSDYNLVWTSGSVVAQRGTPASTYSNLINFRAAITNQERNSLQYRPGIISNTNLLPNPADTAVWAINARGEFLPEITTDFSGAPRPASLLHGIIDLGAYEVSPTSIPPLCVASPATPVAGGTQAFLFALDTVAKITHDALSSAPTSLGIRQYVGVRPPFSDSTNFSLFEYIITDAPTGSYNYNMEYFYKNTRLRNIPAEQDLRLAQKVPGNAWTLVFGSAVDTTRNIMSASFLTSYDMFTGTDIITPLPVDLVSFRGNKQSSDAVLNWVTASEQNVSHFELERSEDAQVFVYVSTTPTEGNYNTQRNYIYVDANVFGTRKVVYYRLKMVDRDGTFAYSPVIRLSNEDVPTGITIGPNPFKNKLVINQISETDQIQLMDITGKSITGYQVTYIDGKAYLQLTENIPVGTYFLKISGQQQVVFKLVKE